ncbi:MAG: lipid-A-disaccharide synthase N-terminal domain-containing protein [Proteobacteria bacterium]|nr:lipid-A-disaccharide synthase N-terminal domain-containing protein [Pseudomonadota bacterium]
MLGNVLLWFTTVPHIWKVIGLAGQGLFAARFIVQWFQSEREGRSVIPVAFWYCSIGGGVVLLAYALYVGDAVFIIGQASGLIVYARNLFLIFKERRQLEKVAHGEAV